MQIDVRPGDDGWREVEPLMAAVYPPEILATIVWRDVTWAEADHWVLVREEERLIATVGVYWRNGLHDGSPVRLGGIGGVATHPAHRARGHASAALQRAQQLFGEAHIDFGLLCCEPETIAFYAARSWQVFGGELFVEQPGGRQRFTVITPMVRAARRAAPTAGAIDLCGLPW